MYVVLYTPYFIKADLTSMNEDLSASPSYIKLLLHICFLLRSQLSFYFIIDRILQLEGEIKIKFCKGTFFSFGFSEK